MARFVKLEAVRLSDDSHGTAERGPGGGQEQNHASRIRAADFHYVNIYTIDEIVPTTWRRDKKDGTTEDVPATYLVVHYEGAIQVRQSDGPRDRDTYYLVYGAAEGWRAKIEKMIADDIADHHIEPSVPAPAPVNLGYAAAASNGSVLAVTVTDIDDYDDIEFAGRAARTAALALAATRFSLKVDKALIPINSSPISPPYYVLTIPGADNIAVSRSADGEKLYILGQDNAAAFGIEVLGHKE